MLSVADLKSEFSESVEQQDDVGCVVQQCRLLQELQISTQIVC